MDVGSCQIFFSYGMMIVSSCIILDKKYAVIFICVAFKISLHPWFQIIWLWYVFVYFLIMLFCLGFIKLLICWFIIFIKLGKFCSLFLNIFCFALPPLPFRDYNYMSIWHIDSVVVTRLTAILFPFLLFPHFNSEHFCCSVFKFAHLFFFTV